ncbi:unnamed protein product [Lactuca saligna]|uniref:Uncharacterized protein n=1 Tax=Lactuca saligna TaxID=75948 RepID=A0AA35UMJ7_LACSI|nr:unnamed protein product [Lactuca saligna]
MHMDTIRKNGFSLEKDLDAPPGQRYKIKVVPFSKNITFGVAANNKNWLLHLIDFSLQSSYSTGLPPLAPAPPPPAPPPPAPPPSSSPPHLRSLLTWQWHKKGLELIGNK